MKNRVFKKRFYAKCVLSGEHSVLRGFPALVYPLPHFYIDVEYKKSPHPLKWHYKKDIQKRHKLLLGLLIKKALKEVGKKKEDLRGDLKIKSNMPFGVGLGGSSVICSIAASLMAWGKWIKESEKQTLATSLENLFHGKSSGMDVASSLKGKPLIYEQGKKPKNLPSFKSKPLLFISFCGKKSSTSKAVKKVERLFKKDKKKAKKLDQQMFKSVKLCLKARTKSKKEALSLLIKAFFLAEDCYKSWGLFSPDLKKHSQTLKDKGALATKPTGAGMGGYVISLWEKKPQIKGLKSFEI